MPFIEQCFEEQSTASTGQTMRVMKQACWSHSASVTSRRPQQPSCCSSAKQHTFLCAACRNSTPATPWVHPWGTRVRQASCAQLQDHRVLTSTRPPGFWPYPRFICTASHLQTEGTRNSCPWCSGSLCPTQALPFLRWNQICTCYYSSK